jgi:dTMP kinase
VLENFIVLEGLDGAGTTTQLGLLDRALKRARVPHCCTFEPTRGPIGRLIKDVLHGRAHAAPYTMALLYAADRKEHLDRPRQGMRSRLARGELVVSDRYLFSSLAYQSIENDFETVLALNRAFPLPAHLYFIDTSPEVCRQRMARRRRAELFDGLEFQRRVYDAYGRAFREFADSAMVVHRLDGGLSTRDLLHAIWTDLKKLPIFKT